MCTTVCACFVLPTNFIYGASYRLSICALHTHTYISIHLLFSVLPVTLHDKVNIARRSVLQCGGMSSLKMHKSALHHTATHWITLHQNASNCITLRHNCSISLQNYGLQQGLKIHTESRYCSKKGKMDLQKKGNGGAARLSLRQSKCRKWK